MLNFMTNFAKDESGAAMVEYAIALLVAAGIGVLTFTTMGNQAATNATAACGALTGATTTAGC